MRATFIDLCLRGAAVPGDLARFVAAWQEAGEPETLPDWLGLTAEEYSICILDPEACAIVVARRRARLEEA